ncbi:MAG: SDR family NAD(P)-dependent oxidoreductase [Betaproteobacteria bacterium]
MSGRLAGKVAIVTGAGSSGPELGNGKATAILFAREGAKVLCADAVEERARETAEAIAAEGGSASAWRADVSKASDCKAMVEAAVARYGRLDVLDNNVGISVRETREQASALGTEGTGWDVAWAAVFLASDEARWITGVALPVGAGFLVMSPTTGARLAQQKF